MATISDVARLSGMSVSTVSRVINNKPHVSEEKRQKILEAMDALGIVRFRRQDSYEVRAPGI